MSNIKNRVLIVSIFMIALLLVIFLFFFNEMRDNKLHNAIYRENLEEVKTLLARGENLERRDYSGNTPLHAAADKKLEFVDFLVKSGAKVNAKNFVHEIPLYDACRKGDLEIVKYLIKNGADVNAENKILETPLHKSRKIEVCEYLIKSGADVNARDESGETPIYGAVDSGSFKFVDLLVKSGASVNEKTKRLSTPLHQVARSERSENSNKEISESFVIAQYLIKNGADVNAKDETGETPIYYAIRFGNMPMVELFVKNGANVNDKNKELETPLSEASFNNFKIVKFLIDKGAQINVIDKTGNTILHKAVYSDSSINSVKYLVLSGADVDAKNNDGKTPRDLADIEIRNFFELYKDNPEKVKIEIKSELEKLIAEKKED